MNKLDILKEVIREHRDIRLVEDGIYTATTNLNHTPQYDKKAGIYDFIVGSRLYNRVMWGVSPHRYTDFARKAVGEHPTGLILDAGCGSMLFTARVYAENGRTVIACDQSLDMLRQARSRLTKLGVSVLDRVVLVQADLSDIPFREDSFETVLCMNVFHHYPDAAELALKLKNVLVCNGNIFLTSLVLNNRFIGDKYLKILHKKDWLVAPRKTNELRTLLQDALKTNVSFWTEGNMSYATAIVEKSSQTDSSGCSATLHNRERT